MPKGSPGRSTHRSQKNIVTVSATNMFGSMKSSTAVRIFRQPSDKQRRPKGAVGPVKKK
jgi:hypothetical protein